MSAKSVYIRDMAEALRAGTVPGSFGPDRLWFEFPEVVTIDSKGAERHWQLRVELRDPSGNPVPIAEDILENPISQLPKGYKGVLSTETWQVSTRGAGEPTRGKSATLVTSGKRLSTQYPTNVITQALRDGLSQYNKQKRLARPPPAADTDGEDEPAEGAGLRPPPMLVKKLGATREATLTPKDFAEGVVVQRKFNGVRLVAYLTQSDNNSEPPEVVLYSRTGELYAGLQAQRKDLRALLQAAGRCPAPGGPAGAGPVYLDGELYKHGRSLQEISGQARREDKDEDLDYVVFDCFFPELKARGVDTPNRARQDFLDCLFRAAGASAEPHSPLSSSAAASGTPPVQGGQRLGLVVRAENFRVQDMAEVDALYRRFLNEGYEGAIARKDFAGYRYSFNNYHSANLVKIKPIFDAEFEVVGYTQGTRGKDRGAVIWICRVDPEHADPEDDQFNVTPKDMTNEERKEIYKCLGRPADGGGTLFEKYLLGKPLTVEFPERSKKGKPLRAKSLAFRTYEGGPEADPVLRMLAECRQH